MQGLKPAADAKGIQIIASVDSNVGEIYGDSRRLQQVLWNLAHNHHVHPGWWPRRCRAQQPHSKGSSTPGSRWPTTAGS